MQKRGQDPKCWRWEDPLTRRPLLSLAKRNAMVMGEEEGALLKTKLAV